MLSRRTVFRHRLRLLSTLRSADNARLFSVLNRPPPSYEGHVPLTPIERGVLAVGSAIGSLLNPRRDGMEDRCHHSVVFADIYILDLIATLGEVTATPYFIYRLRDAMLSSPTGRQILRDRPRITSSTLSMTELRSLPLDTVGRTYADWLDREGVSPDTRSQVRYIDDEECAYVMQRYRECHDFYHALTGLPVFVEGEIALKAFEFTNTLLPMTGFSLAAIVKLKKAERERIFSTYLPWALRNGLSAKEVINVYWERELHKDVHLLRKELGVEKPPDLRDTRRAIREEKKRLKEMEGLQKG